MLIECHLCNGTFSEENLLVDNFNESAFCPLCGGYLGSTEHVEEEISILGYEINLREED